ncbi:pilus assembly protein [Pseudoduganella sp. FT26W]|jgi:Flp pilus assembly protein TadG|uniref:Pilus assembly protein n=2 Tax=Duganella TaxID=75654 RepID=A0A6L5QPR1_9BURK|nr:MULTISPECIES: TadE/TadG family type IV pilus assembly protein [Duganella]MRW87494.1 pilus assembly protein [Duganella aquatilis]MRX11803.1 pilus assembly protein [Duganella alba]MRX19961.1 pilus assembly protein [Duganella alba]
MRVPGFLRRQRGSAVVEMAIVAPVAFLLLIGLIEFSLVFFVTLTMQYAVREGARYAVTGRTDVDPTSRLKSVMQVIRTNSMGYLDTVCPVFSVNGTVSSTANAATVLGAPGDIVVLRLDCTWNLATPIVAAVFPSGQYKFAVAATMQNEAFTP